VTDLTQTLVEAAEAAIRSRRTDSLAGVDRRHAALWQSRYGGLGESPDDRTPGTIIARGVMLPIFGRP
jgi:hypothetical protein